MCSVGDLLPRSGGGMACQAAGKPWQAIPVSIDLIQQKETFS
uniref:Uncharacterized protein n=1 Tax=Escherichia coli TaxID=562 RepID=A0A890DKF5_ECOLX|nr:hypothetical protein [Escherichia coli]